MSEHTTSRFLKRLELVEKGAEALLKAVEALSSEEELKRGYAEMKSLNPYEFYSSLE